MLIHGICSSSDLLHSIWQTLGPSASRSITQFHSFYDWVIFHCVYVPQLFNLFLYLVFGLPWWLSGEESICSVGVAGDTGSIPGSERSPGGEHDNPLQCSCLKNRMDRGAWHAAVYGVTESQTRLSDWAGNETVTGRKPRGPQGSGGNKLQVAVVFCFFVFCLLLMLGDLWPSYLLPSQYLVFTPQGSILINRSVVPIFSYLQRLEISRSHFLGFTSTYIHFLVRFFWSHDCKYHLCPDN